MATMFGDATGLSSATTDKIYLIFREDKRLFTEDIIFSKCCSISKTLFALVQRWGNHFA